MAQEFSKVKKLTDFPKDDRALMTKHLNMLRGEVEHEKGLKMDVMQNKSAFNAHNARVLMPLEIHECFEAGHFDFIHEDNMYNIENGGPGVCLLELPLTGEGEEPGEVKTVLALPTNVRYSDWRKLYDELTA